MADPVSGGDTAIRRVALAAAFTLSVAAILFIVDRGILGPVRSPGWIEVGAIEDVPREAGAIVVPAYLPHALSWPPHRIFYQLMPVRGWWVELSGAVAAAGAPGAGATAWLGSTNTSAPGPMGAAQGCLEAAPTAVRCPEGWHLLSAHDPQGSETLLVTNIEANEAARIITGLQLH